MPKLYVIPQEQPNAFATGRNPKHSAVAVTARDPQAALRGRAARRARPRARPRPQPRHPDTSRSPRRSARRSPRSPTCCSGSAATTTRRSALSPRSRWSCWRRSRRRSSSWRSRASASTRPTPTGARDLRQPGVARLALLRLEAGGPGDPDAGQPGGRAALHRQAVQRRRASRPSSRRTRRSRSGSAGCARCGPTHQGRHVVHIEF